MSRKNKRRKQLLESAKRARLSRQQDHDSLPALKEFGDSDNDFSDDDSNDEIFMVEKVWKNQSIISLFKKQLSKLEKETPQSTAEADKQIQDNVTDKQVATASAKSVSSTESQVDKGVGQKPRVQVQQQPQVIPPIQTVKLRLRLFGNVLPQRLRLNSRWNRSRRVRTAGHRSLSENAFSTYRPRGLNGGRPPVVNVPNARQKNREMNLQRVQDARAEVTRKREEKQRSFRKCVDVLEHAWLQPTLAGRFSCVYKPGVQEKTVCP